MAGRSVGKIAAVIFLQCTLTRHSGRPKRDPEPPRLRHIACECLPVSSRCDTPECDRYLGLLRRIELDIPQLEIERRTSKNRVQVFLRAKRPNNGVRHQL